jgi:hypothetical protein
LEDLFTKADGESSCALGREEPDGRGLVNCGDPVNGGGPVNGSQRVLVAVRRDKEERLRYKLQLIISLQVMENNVPQAESCGYLQLC